MLIMKLRTCFIVGGLTCVVSLPLWSLREGLSKQWVDEIRALKIQRLDSARAFDILKDYSSVVSATLDQPETAESLTLSLLENVKRQSIELHADLTALSVTDSHETLPTALRVEFNATVPRAIDLLTLFDAVREVAGWRPMQVLECTLLRADETTGLHTVCVIDVYYFPEIDA